MLIVPVPYWTIPKVWYVPVPLSLTTGSPIIGTPNFVSVIPGTYSGVDPGIFNFPVPNYNSLTVTIRAGGGGGALLDQGRVYAAGNGGSSVFGSSTNLTANGGLGHDASGNPPPANQGGSGGTVTTGGGGAAGQGADTDPGYVEPNATYNGSAGGRVTKTWNRTDVGAPIPGTMIGMTIGGAGTPGTVTGFAAYPGGKGSVNINWS